MALLHVSHRILFVGVANTCDILEAQLFARRFRNDLDPSNFLRRSRERPAANQT